MIAEPGQRPALSAFAPTLDAARSRLRQVRPEAYARSRNHLDGAATRLSPYITHGLLSLPEVWQDVQSRHGLAWQHKFAFELGWREYFAHVRERLGDGILQSLHAGPLPDAAYRHEVPADLREGRTGVPVIDQAVRALYADSYLHNHARMWLASYAVHLRKVHWRAGADWMLPHLLDGDLASNHLSWQWVAGTASRKPYLFNADNVQRFAPPAWHSAGSVLDVGYDALERMAFDARPLGAAARADGLAEPATCCGPPDGAGFTTPSATDVAGRDVWLMHPWALGETPADLPAGSLVLAVVVDEAHAGRPWSQQRWDFVGARMQSAAAVRWRADAATVAAALHGARSVQTVSQPDMSALWPADVCQRPVPRLFPRVERDCTSFSTWWRLATRRLPALDERQGGLL